MSSRTPQVIATYDEFLASGKNDAERVGWKDKAHQNELFAILLDGVRQRESRAASFTVLDAGCGLGAFSEALRDEFPCATYTGMDVHEPSLLLARQRYPGHEFIHYDVRKPPADRQWDYVVACGLFNIFYGLDEKEHIRNGHSSLIAMWRTAKRGLLWNHITDFGNDFKKTGVYYAPPCGVHEWAMENLSPHVTIRQDYYRWAFSVYAYKATPP